MKIRTLEEIIRAEQEHRTEGGMFGIEACKESIRSSVELFGSTLEELLTEYVDRANTDVFFNKAMVLACYELMQEEAEQAAEEPEQTEEAPKTREEIIEAIIDYFKNDEELFNDCIEELDSYNGYLGDDRYYYMNDIDELYHDTEPTELLARVFYGYDENNFIIDKWEQEHRAEFNPNREYFRYNGYGNLVSADFKDYSDHLDHWAIEQMEQYRRYIYSIGDDAELSELFDILEEAEETEAA